MRLYPVHRMLGPEEGLYDSLDLRNGRLRSSSGTLPYVIINMVSSVDGKASVAGSASGLGSLEDRSVMRSLRSKVDAVMIGAGTLRAERLSLGLDGEGRQPVGVILSSDPASLPLKNLVSPPGRQRLLVLTGSDGRDARDDRVEIVRAPDPGPPESEAALNILSQKQGVGTLLVEGGPTLNAALLSLGLVDELFLTLAPKVSGGDAKAAPTIAEGPALVDAPTPLRLVSVFAAADELFLRYALR